MQHSRNFSKLFQGIGELISEAEGDVPFDNKRRAQKSGPLRKIDSWVRDIKLGRQTDFPARDLTIFMSYTGPVHLPHEKSGHDFCLFNYGTGIFLATLCLGKLLGSRFSEKPSRTITLRLILRLSKIPA